MEKVVPLFHRDDVVQIVLHSLYYAKNVANMHYLRLTPLKLSLIFKKQLHLIHTRIKVKKTFESLHDILFDSGRFQITKHAVSENVATVLVTLRIKDAMETMIVEMKAMSSTAVS